MYLWFKHKEAFATFAISNVYFDKYYFSALCKYFFVQLNKGIVRVNFHFFVIVYGLYIKIRYRYVFGNNDRKFQVFTMKIEPMAPILRSRIVSALLNKHFQKRNNKLINLCEIRLFQ